MKGSTLSEAASKALLARYGVPLAEEAIVRDVDEAVAAGDRLGYPVVAKLNGSSIAHKTERGLVRLSLGDATALRDAVSSLFAAARPEDGEVSVLVAPMLRGARELIAGVVRDAQFGPAVMIGLGGVLAEVLGDVSFRLAPLSRLDAHEMIDDLATVGVLAPFRGEPAVDRDALAAVLLGLSALIEAHDDIESVDVNPLIVCDGLPVAVDALVALRERDV